MERCAELIEKLKKDYDQRMSVEHLLALVGQLQLELVSKLQSNTPVAATVAVVPPKPTVRVALEKPAAPVVPTSQKEEASPDVAKKFTTLVPPAVVYAEPVKEKVEPAQKPKPAPAVQVAAPVVAIATDGRPELNDKLQQTKSELADKLKDAPIKDLRKGFSLNERFVFVKELFRGDDVSFERSIKTINSLNSFTEAKMWIERELRTLNGWKNGDETVDQFYEIVKRRFI